MFSRVVIKFKDGRTEMIEVPGRPRELLTISVVPGKTVQFQRSNGVYEEIDDGDIRVHEQ